MVSPANFRMPRAVGGARASAGATARAPRARCPLPGLGALCQRPARVAASQGQPRARGLGATFFNPEMGFVWVFCPEKAGYSCCRELLGARGCPGRAPTYPASPGEAGPGRAGPSSAPGRARRAAPLPPCPRACTEVCTPCRDASYPSPPLLPCNTGCIPPVQGCMPPPVHAGCGRTWALSWSRLCMSPLTASGTGSWVKCSGPMPVSVSGPRRLRPPLPGPGPGSAPGSRPSSARAPARLGSARCRRRLAGLPRSGGALPRRSLLHVMAGRSGARKARLLSWPEHHEAAGSNAGAGASLFLACPFGE